MCAFGCRNKGPSVEKAAQLLKDFGGGGGGGAGATAGSGGGSAGNTAGAPKVRCDVRPTVKPCTSILLVDSTGALLGLV